CRGRGAGDADGRGDRRRRRTQRGREHELRSHSHEHHPHAISTRAGGVGWTALRAANRATDELERLLAGREEPGGALLLDGDEQPTDLRAGRQAELVAPEQRLVRVVLARRLYLGREFGRADERERLE